MGLLALLYAPTILSVYKYWPDYGFLRPKPVANSGNNKIKREL
jgi:hypothetical protein